MLLRPGRMVLDHGARENRHRPAIDPLFRTAAQAYGSRVVGVLLTGLLTDGVAGLMAVRSAGEVAVVQDPAEAVATGMPRAALQQAGADYVLPVADIGRLLVQLVRQPEAKPGVLSMPDPLEHLTEQMGRDMDAQANSDRRGQITFYTCPECGGSLWQADQDKLLRFRCHVGHCYYGESLLEQKSQILEAALWTAARTLQGEAGPVPPAGRAAAAVRQRGGRRPLRRRSGTRRALRELDPGTADRRGAGRQGGGGRAGTCHRLRPSQRAAADLTAACGLARADG